MDTRSGSVDPGLVLWLVTEAGMDAAEVTRGARTVVGPGRAHRDVGRPAGGARRGRRGRRRARLGLDVYVHRLRREIAAMAAALGGLDVLVFTGGVGEHLPAVRTAAAAGLGFLGVAIDGERNAATTGDGDITAADGVGPHRRRHGPRGPRDRPPGPGPRGRRARMTDTMRAVVLDGPGPPDP